MTDYVTRQIDNGSRDRKASARWIIAEWYEAKENSKLALVRFEVEDAKMWLSDVQGFLKPAFNKLLGRKPEAGRKEKVAEVNLKQN